MLMLRDSRVEIQCATCGKPKLIRRSKKGERNYCNRACASAALKQNTGSKNANWKGGLSLNNHIWWQVQKLRNGQKIAARQKLRRAIKKGDVQAEPCNRCGAQDTQPHHHSYDDPLDIEWLCVRCHAAVHGRGVGRAAKRKESEGANSRTEEGGAGHYQEHMHE